MNKVLKKQKAWTIFELVIVIIVVMILFAAIYYAWPGKKINVVSTAHQLAADIRYLQNLSVTRNQRYRINFSASQYTLTELDGVTAVIHPATGSNIINLPNGITLSTSSVPNNYLVFDGKGVPYVDNGSPGTSLTLTATITLTTDDGNAAQVTVSPETGRVGVS